MGSLVALDVDERPAGILPAATSPCGWTWYTGSAAGLYRFAIEAILGLRREGSTLHRPGLPRDWPGYEATLRLDGTVYTIRVETTGETAGEPPRRVAGFGLDGREVEGPSVPL